MTYTLTVLTYDAVEYGGVSVSMTDFSTVDKYLDESTEARNEEHRLVLKKKSGTRQQRGKLIKHDTKTQKKKLNPNKPK